MKAHYLVLCLFVVGIVSYDGNDFKFYGTGIDQQEIFNLFDLIAPEHKQDLRMVKVYPEKDNYQHGGFYWCNGVLELYQHDLRVVVHELAHHAQIQNGESCFKVHNHLGEFRKYKAVIWHKVVTNGDK